MKLLKTLLIAMIAVMSTQAMAWGAREQGFLTGIGAVLLGQHLANAHNGSAYGPVYQQPAPVYQQPPVYMQPAPPPVYVQPARPVYGCQYRGQEIRLYDQDGDLMSIQFCR